MHILCFKTLITYHNVKGLTAYALVSLQVICRVCKTSSIYEHTCVCVYTCVRHRI